MVGRVPDGYAATAGTYDLFNASVRAAQMAALEAVMPQFRPEIGPVLDIGAGSGLNTLLILERVPEAQVLAVEPSPSMRALILAKVAARPEWFARVTIRPEDFFSSTLPACIGGAILLGTLGHFDAGERAAVLAELADRLPVGGVALIDFQPPEQPRRVEPFEFTAATIGDLSYRCIAEAWPVEADVMHWRMTYLTLEGERVLVEDTAEHEYRHPAPMKVAGEAAQVGLRLDRLGESTYWTLTRTP